MVAHPSRPVTPVTIERTAIALDFDVPDNGCVAVRTEPQLLLPSSGSKDPSTSLIDQPVATGAPIAALAGMATMRPSAQLLVEQGVELRKKLPYYTGQSSNQTIPESSG